MPKGSAPNIIHTRTLTGKILPGKTRQQFKARKKNMLREIGRTDSQVTNDIRTQRFKSEARADPGTGPIPRVTRNPVKSLKQRAAQKPAKKK